MRKIAVQVDAVGWACGSCHLAEPLDGGGHFCRAFGDPAVVAPLEIRNGQLLRTKACLWAEVPPVWIMMCVLGVLLLFIETIWLRLAQNL